MAGLYGRLSDPLLGIGPTPSYSSSDPIVESIHDAPPEFYSDPVDLPPDHSDSEELPEPPAGPTGEEAIAATRARLQGQERPQTGLEQFLPSEHLTPLDRLILGTGRGLEAGAAGLAGAGEAVARGVTGGQNNRVADYLGQMGESAQKEGEALQNPEGGLDVAGWVGQQIGGFIPLALSSLAGGLPGFIAAGAIQAGGGAFKRAQTNFVANGDDDTTASLKALPVGILSGGVNALIARQFSPNGSVGQALENGLDRAALTGIVRGAAHAAGLGAGWGGSEALSQDLIERFADNPKKSISDIITDTLGGVASGAGMGLALAGLHGAGQRIIRQFAPSGGGGPEPLGPSDGRTMEQVQPDSASELFAGKFDPGDVQMSRDGDAYLRMGQGKNGINVLNRMGLITNDEMFDVGDPVERLKIFGRVADRLEADGLSGLVDEKGRTISTKVLRGQAEEGPSPQTEPAGPSEEFQQAQAEQSEPVPEPARETPEPTVENVRAAGLRRWLRISDQNQPQPEEVTNATTPGQVQSDVQQQRQGIDGYVQSEGPDREQPAVLAPEGSSPIAGNSLPGTAGAIAQASQDVEANPSEAQKEAGNYQKGHVSVQGLNVTIENPVGSTRTGVDKGGKPWSVVMPATYGYVKGTKGKDGDHVDIYLGPQPDLPNVYVVDQQNAENKSFDEHKVLIGFPDKQSAITAYDRAFSDNRGPERRAAVTPTTMDQFKEWLANGDQKKPFAQSGSAQATPAPTTVLNSGSSEVKQAPLPDIIDYFQDNIGRIKGKGSSKAGTEGYYGENYKAAIRHSAVRKLFTNRHPGAVSPDEAVDDLRRAGYLGQDATWDDVVDLLDKAGQRRKGMAGNELAFNREVEEKAKQRQDFEQAFHTRLHPTTTLPTSKLLIGDTFQLFGQHVTVKDLLFDPETDHLAYVELEDGRRFGTQLVDAEHVLHVDLNSYTANPEATEFLPKTDRDMSADEIRAIDEQINELRAKEKLTTEDHRKLELLEQQRGQKMIAWTEPQAVAADIAREEDRRRRLAQMPRGNLTLEGETQAPHQSSLFELTIPPEGTQFRKAVERFAAENPFTTFDQFRSKVVASSLPPGVKRSMLTLMDSPGLSGLNWNGFFFALGRGLPPGAGGFVSGNRLAIDQGNALATTLPHEVTHLLWNSIPEEMRAAVERARLAEVRAKYGPTAPEPLVAGKMSSEQFLSSGLASADYHLTSPEEYFASFAGNKFASDFIDREYPGTGIWQKIVDWFKALWNTIKQHFIHTDPDRQAMSEVYDRMMKGEFQPSPEKFGEPKASFLQSAEGARNVEKLTEGTVYQKTEAAHALAQGTDFVRILDAKGAATAGPLAQSLLRYQDYLQFKQSGTNLNGGISQDFRALLARPDLSEFEKKWLSRVAARQAVTFHATLEEVSKIGAEANRQMASPTFLKQLAREALLHSQLNQAEAVNRASDLILHSAYDRAWKALREEAQNDLEVARIEAQLKEIDLARKSSSAMVQLLRDIVQVLSSTTKGQDLLMNPNVRRSDLVDLYRDLKKATGQPIQAESLVNWGSFVLARSADLRNDLVAAYYQQANPYVQHGLSHYEKMLFDDLKKDPAGTIFREVRLAKRRQSNEDKLRFTWWQLNRDVMAKLAKLTGEVEAGMIARSTIADPDYHAVTNLMKKEGGLLGVGKPLQPYVDTVLMTPSGRAVDISTVSMRGAGVRDKLWPQWESARNEFIDHINNNPDDANNPLYQQQLNALEEYYHDEIVRNPHDRDLIWKGAQDSVQEAAFRASGSTAASLSRAIQKWSMVKERGAAQVQYDAHSFFLARDKTLFSHGLRHDMNGGKEPIEVVSRKFSGDHMNEVLYSLNRQAGPLKVGDETRNGYKVTPEDLAEAALQSDIYERAWKVVKDAFGGEDFHVTITDPRTGLTMSLTPVKGTRYFVARRFEPNQRAFADAFVKSLGNEQRAQKVINSLDPAVTAAQKVDARNQLVVEQKHQIELLEAPGTWDRQLYGFVADRNPDFARPTPFDGPGKAFELAAPLATRSQLKTFDQFIDFLAAHSAVPKDEARQIVLTEWKRLIGAIGDDQESPLIVDPKSATKTNTFTKGRMEAHAPFTFYRYGLTDGSDLSLLLSYVHSRALERVENGLKAVQSDLEDRISELRNKADLSSRKQVVSARQAEVRAGKNYDSYEDLLLRKGVVDRVLRYLADPDPEDKGDITFRRITGGATGAIVQNSMTTIQNMIGSWMFLGRLSVKLNSKPFFDYPAAFWYTFQQVPKAGFHLARAGTLAVGHGVAGMARAVREAVASHNKGRRIRTFASVPLENAIFELSEQMFKAYAPELVRHGINPVQNKKNEIRARMLLGWARGGRIGSEEMTGGKRVYHSIVGAVEIPLTLVGTVLPTIGDLSQNKGTIAMLVNNPVGFKRSIQRALDRVNKAGLRTFNWLDLKDPANTLSHRELGYLTKAGLEEAAVLMREAGLSIQTEAMRYLKALHDRAPNPEFISGDSLSMLLDHMNGALNKAIPANKTIIIEDANKLVKFIRPLLGWSLRTWNFLLRAFSSASYQEQRWAWWCLGSTMGVLGFLAGEVFAGLVSDEIARLMSRVYYEKESNKKMPWEYDTTQQQILALGKNAFYNVPLLGAIMNVLLGDVPTRASATPSFVLLEKFRDLVGYVGSLWQTGDPRFGLTKVATSLVPEARVLANRIPSEIGRVQGQNASALIRRYAPTDLVKPLQPAAVAGVLTELSPYGNMLENEALKGDDRAFRSVYDQAVAIAKKNGLANPEQRVRQSFLARNPIDRVFKVKPTQLQLNDLMARMGQGEREQVQTAMNRFRHAAGLIGADVSFTAEPSMPTLNFGTGRGLRNGAGRLPAFSGRR